MSMKLVQDDHRDLRSCVRIDTRDAATDVCAGLRRRPGRRTSWRPRRRRTNWRSSGRPRSAQPARPGHTRAGTRSRHSGTARPEPADHRSTRSRHPTESSDAAADRAAIGSDGSARSDAQTPSTWDERPGHQSGHRKARDGEHKSSSDYRSRDDTPSNQSCDAWDYGRTNWGASKRPRADVAAKYSAALGSVG